MFKKIITSIILTCFIFVNVAAYLTPMAKAQEDPTWYFQNYTDWHARVYDEDNPEEIFGERYTAAQVEWVMYGIAAFIINHVIGDRIAACVIEAAVNEEETLASACLERIGRAMLDVLGMEPNDTAYDTTQSNEYYAQSTNPVKYFLSENRPISGIGYLKDSVSKFSPVSEVQAQGFGFTAANAIRSLWVAVRNVSYFFLILLVIGMAFLVMFRFKINPQTVITIQSALPKIIGALLLITFSYAIAGFLIDLMYVLIGIMAAILQSSGLFEGPSWSEMYDGLTGSGIGRGIFSVMFFYFLAFVVTSFMALSSNFLGFVGSLVGVTQIIWIIIIVIALIALLFILVKILWMLTKTYVTVLILIAVSPIVIITGGFVGWVKNLASNLAVFVAIGPMFAISFLFLASAFPTTFYAEILPFIPTPEQTISSLMPFSPEENVLEGSPWSPPFLPGGSDMDIVWLFASFVIITLIPNAANMIKSAIQGKPFGYGTAIGAAIGGAAGVAWSPFGSVVGSAREATSKEMGAKLYNRFAGSRFGQAINLPIR